MRFQSLLAVMATAFMGTALAAPTPVDVHPGTNMDLVLTGNNTVNATTPPTNGPEASGGQLDLALVNNLGSGVNCYVTGLNSNGELVLLQPDGSFYKPPSPASGPPQQITQNVAIPLNGGKGSTTKITIPGYISSARVWFAQGSLKFYVVQGANGAPSLVEPSAVNPSDPSANVNWGFVELSNVPNAGLYANISYVDFVGLPLGMQLTDASGGTQTAKGLPANAVSSICNDLAAQGSQDGQPWGDLCVKSGGKALRVLNPTDYLSVQNGAFSSYWSSYVDKVWSTFSSQTLTINTQAAAGKVSCKVSGNLLQCDGDNRGYAKPTAGDIFGCNSGPFGIISGDNAVHYAVVPRLCAAFNRGTFFVNGGSTQPGPSGSSYYTTSPTNHYSRIVHKYETDGKGYAFSYDDVNPDGENASGVVSSPNPSLLTVTVGGS